MLKKVTVNLGLLNFEELKNLSTMKTPGLTVLWESDTKLYRTFFSILSKLLQRSEKKGNYSPTLSILKSHKNRKENYKPISLLR